MSYLSITNKYSVYSQLLSNTYSTGSISSSLSSSLLGMYSNIYGTNTASSSTNTSNYLVDIKEKSSDILDTLESLNAKGSSSLFKNTVAAKSNNSAVTAQYSGSETQEDFEVEVSQIASSQKNESISFNKRGAAIYSAHASKINIETSDGKSLSINYSANISDTDEKTLNKIASKINDANIGINASVQTDSKTGTNKLVLSSKETGSENTFSVSGDLAEALGINNVSTAAADAVYSINGEQHVSSSNKIEFEDGTKLTLNSTTTENKPAKISYKNDMTDAINATRELVNNFNALASTAYKSTDTGAAKLSKQLQAAADTYSASLSRIGISMNSKGYLEIDSDKMQSAADSGELSRFFNANSNNTKNYGFAYRLETIASKANSDPTTYLSNPAKSAINSTSNAGYSLTSSGSSRNYINTYYRYSTAALLFDTLL